jgi:hypothetical protein
MARPAVSLPGTRTLVLQREPRRGLFGHMLAVLLQPVAFFRQMPTTRQWLGTALIILFLVGMAEVRRTALLAEVEGSDSNIAVPSNIPPDFPAGPTGPGQGGIPLDPTIPTGIVTGDTASARSITETTIIALIAASSLVLAWLLQAFVLLPVPMFNGYAPSLARNIQVVVWASVPLGLLALIQLIYYAVGGSVGDIGVSILLERWAAYATLPPFLQALLHSLSLHLTLFWLWSLILLYVGARNALGGRWWAAALIWLIWLTLVLLIPVMTGAVQPLEVAPVDASSADAPLAVPIDAMPAINADMLSGSLPSNADIIERQSGGQDATPAVEVSPP